jgi:FtsP/CotA-like multicopper oxidase with cupredoxin domain
VTLDSTGLEPDAESGQHVGPSLVLTRGMPVSIMVRNHLAEPTSIHWHGIELESIYDGVPGISGIRPQIATAIAPGDSFDVRLALPRAGTFIYHSQLNETRQQRAGLVGALIVVEKGKRDSTKDIAVLISSPSDSALEERAVLINGSVAPLKLELRRATAYRLRLINITTARQGMSVELRQDTTVTTWRPLAKDGIDTPATARGVRTARQPLSIGETMDVEFLPTRAGDYRLEVRTRLGAVLGTLPIRVQ